MEEAGEDWKPQHLTAAWCSQLGPALKHGHGWSCPDTTCSAHADASHRVLPTLSDSAHSRLVPWPDHPCPMAPVGSAAPAWLSHPSTLCPYLLPATSTPQVGQHLCHFNIGPGFSPPDQGTLLSQRRRTALDLRENPSAIHQWPIAQEATQSWPLNDVLAAKESTHLTSQSLSLWRGLAA